MPADSTKIPFLPEPIEGLERLALNLWWRWDRRARNLFRTIDPELEETPALWNEVWSSLRYDEELRPLVQDRYRAWMERVVGLLDEGREDGSVPRSVDPVAAGWRLAAAADGFDSLLYLGLLDRDGARELLASCMRRELAP